MEIDLSQWYKILAPRPVILVSTVDKEGVSNAAPFSFVMPVSLKPPLVAFASSPAHDTVKNILETKDFVVNIPSKDVLEELWICAGDFPSGVSEIKKSGLTEEKSKKVRSPKIKECIAHFECKLSEQHKAGDHVIIIGQVLAADLKDDYFDNGRYQIEEADSLMHIGGEEFGLLGKIVKVKGSK